MVLYSETFADALHAFAGLKLFFMGMLICCVLMSVVILKISNKKFDNSNTKRKK